LLLVLALAALASDPVLQACLAMLSLGLSLTLHLRRLPFKDEHLNQMESFALTAVLWTLFSGLVFTALARGIAQPSYSVYTFMLLSFLIGPLGALFCIFKLMWVEFRIHHWNSPLGAWLRVREYVPFVPWAHLRESQGQKAVASAILADPKAFDKFGSFPIDDKFLAHDPAPRMWPKHRLRNLGVLPPPAYPKSPVPRRHGQLAPLQLRPAAGTGVYSDGRAMAAVNSDNNNSTFPTDGRESRTDDYRSGETLYSYSETDDYSSMSRIGRPGIFPRPGLSLRGETPVEPWSASDDDATDLISAKQETRKTKKLRSPFKLPSPLRPGGWGLAPGAHPFAPATDAKSPAVPQAQVSSHTAFTRDPLVPLSAFAAHGRTENGNELEEVAYVQLSAFALQPTKEEKLEEAAVSQAAPLRLFMSAES